MVVATAARFSAAALGLRSVRRDQTCHELFEALQRIPRNGAVKAKRRCSLVPGDTARQC